MSELVAAIADSHVGLEDALHRADGAEIIALVQQFCVRLGWSLSGEFLVMEMASTRFRSSPLKARGDAGRGFGAAEVSGSRWR